MGKTLVLSFLGAARTVTGSRFLLEADDARVLVDCGLFQGPKPLRVRNWDRFPVEPGSIDAVLLTHAHLDHSGYLPALVRDGFRGPILATPHTAALAAIVLADSARLQEEEAAFANRMGFSKHRPALPLYTEADAARATSLFRTAPFGKPVGAGSGMRATFRPAGHILGSSTIEVTVESPSRTVFFTGDVGRPSHPILRQPDPVPQVDVVVTESTYGNRRHEDMAASLEVLARAVARTAKRGGVVIVPAFAVDRTEVILLALGRLALEGAVPRLPIYADSPMALEVLDVYRRAIAQADPEVRLSSAPGSDPFDPAGELHEAREPAESRRLNEIGYPSIIVSASGMATGGRVLHHLARRLPDPRNTVVLAGFQAEGTRGRQLADGARSVKMLGKYVPVRADVVEIDGFSVHADCDELAAWLAGTPSAPETAFAVHGEQDSAADLAGRLHDELGWNAVVPSLGERARLD